jgi:fructose-bisphosphate aldolase, class II
MKKYRAGVLFGEELEALYNDAKDNQFALPAVNTIGTNIPIRSMLHWKQPLK